MGHQFRGGNSGDSQGCFSRDTSKSNPDYGAVQHGFEESIEIHVPVDRDVCEEGVAPSNRSGLGRSNQPVLEVYGGCAFAREGEQASVGKPTSDFSDVCTMQCESHGVSVREENAREAANSHLHYGKQAGSSLQANGDLQRAYGGSGNRDRGPSP